MSFDKPEDIPFPPTDLRRLVGPLEQELYDNPTGRSVFPELPIENYQFILDFGCGCGRLARQLLQQFPRPERYVGIDLHRGMIRWCQESLAPFSPNFEFHHHDVFSAAFNPSGREKVRNFPVDDKKVTLLLAWSVFTHLTESSAAFYLREAARVLHPKGVILSTWFLFDKLDFPMMQDFQNALFINDADPTNAVIFDKTWLRNRATESGLHLTRIVPPTIRGFQWQILMSRGDPSTGHVDFPEDTAPRGLARAPLGPESADLLGLER